MSFAKSRRFTYSAPPKELPERQKATIMHNHVQNNIKSDKNNFSREADIKAAENTTTTYTLCIPSPKIRQNSNKTSKSNHTFRKIANTFNKTFSCNTHRNNLHMKDKEKTFIQPDKDFKTLSVTLNWENFEKGVNKELKKILIEAGSKENAAGNDDRSLNDTVAKEIEKSLHVTGTRIREHMDEAVSKIIEECNRKLKHFIEEMTTNNLNVLEEVQNQCQDGMKSLSSTVREILRKENGTVLKERDYRNIVGVLTVQLDETKQYAKYLETNYARLLEAADKKINHQAALIESLKEELNAADLSFNMQKMKLSKKQNKFM